MPRFPVPGGGDRGVLAGQGGRARAGRTGSPAASPTTRREQAEYEVGVICQMGFPGYFLVIADLVALRQGAAASGSGPGRGSAAGALDRLRAGHHRARPDQARPAVRAVPQPRARLDARHRHGLRRAPARRHDPLRHREVRRGAGRADRHLRHDQGQGRGQGRRPGARLPVRPGRPDHQGDAAGGHGQGHPAGRDLRREHPRYGEAGEFRALYEAEPDVAGRRHRARPRGPQAAVGRARGRRDPVRRAAARRHPDHAPRAGRRDHHPVRHGRLRDARPAQDGLPGPAQPHRPRRLPARTSRPTAARPSSSRSSRSTTGRPTSCWPAATPSGCSSSTAARCARCCARCSRTTSRTSPPSSRSTGPGPMGANAHNDYADRKNGRKPVVPIHPELAEPLAEILGDTYGLIVYQEQVMAIAQKLAGYTPRQRRPAAPGHGQEEEGDPRQGVRPVLRGHAGQRLLRRARSRRCGTSWSRSPTTRSTRRTPPATAWSRTGPPTSRPTTRPSTWPRCSPRVKDDKDKSALYLNECRRMGIKVLPPDVNESDVRLHPGRHRHPVRAVRDPQRRRATWSTRSSRTRTAKGRFADFHDFLRQGRRRRLQQAGRRVADQGRRLRLPRPHPPRPGRRPRAGHRRRPGHQARRGDRPVRPVRRPDDDGARPLGPASLTIPVGEWDKTDAARARARDARPVRLRPPAVRPRARARRRPPTARSPSSWPTTSRSDGAAGHRRRADHRAAAQDHQAGRAVGDRHPRGPRGRHRRHGLPADLPAGRDPAGRGRRRRRARPARQARGRARGWWRWRSRVPDLVRRAARPGRDHAAGGPVRARRWSTGSRRCWPPIPGSPRCTCSCRPAAAPRSCASTTGCGSRRRPALFGDLKALLGPGSVGVTPRPPVPHAGGPRP